MMLHYQKILHSVCVVHINLGIKKSYFIDRDHKIKSERAAEQKLGKENQIDFLNQPNNDPNTSSLHVKVIQLTNKIL